GLDKPRRPREVPRKAERKEHLPLLRRGTCSQRCRRARRRLGRRRAALLAPELAVGVLAVAPQAVARLGRHLARPLAALRPAAVGVAHVLAHALALLLPHLLGLRLEAPLR